jgi:hypothetical protein
MLSIDGWIALSAKDGKVFDKIITILTNEKGEKIFVNTEKIFREDVVNAFTQQNLLHSGYHTLVDTSKLKSGKYTLTMAGTYGTNIYTCDKNLYFSFDVGEKTIKNQGN